MMEKVRDVTIMQNLPKEEDDAIRSVSSKIRSLFEGLVQNNSKGAVHPNDFEWFYDGAVNGKSHLESATTSMATFLRDISRRTTTPSAEDIVAGLKTRFGRLPDELKVALAVMQTIPALQTITIPMSQGTQSINAGVAAALLMSDSFTFFEKSG
eukprot:GHVN01073501.1.p4 GENE.GHVN01073501.1~~GHVN01073501.1.p4  ORF type:complete len:154 (+),score=25.50 GHVN01073501.1:926-1387(+)